MQKVGPSLSVRTVMLLLNASGYSQCMYYNYTMKQVAKPFTSSSNIVSLVITKLHVFYQLEGAG